MCCSGNYHVSISIHAPREGATLQQIPVGQLRVISIHAPREGATVGYVDVPIAGWISIHAPRKGATADFSRCGKPIFISIHAPCEGATETSKSLYSSRTISIHAPREGATPRPRRMVLFLIFQSTPPARGATPQKVEPDRKEKFQSTPPARGATLVLGWLWRDFDISIHAPCEGGDRREESGQRWLNYFNPRPLRGGRRRHPQQPADQRGFQSTPPARGATSLGAKKYVTVYISIHAPREGGDLCCWWAG